MMKFEDKSFILDEEEKDDKAICFYAFGFAPRATERILLYLVPMIENGLCKKLCHRIHPEVSCFTRVVEVRNSTEPIEVGSCSGLEWESLERDHRVYADLARRLTSTNTKRDCIEESISASSTDNFPEESIENTLEPKEEVDGRPSYWSSTGEGNPEVPETLTYRLVSNLCVISEVNIQPFKGDPIYSAKAVRFKMGHPKSFLDVRSSIMDGFGLGQKSDSNDYVWTYISPEFPMTQGMGGNDLNN
ncbi:hypothetical protein ACLOJK_005117 [Asimina triloba]